METLIKIKYALIFIIVFIVLPGIVGTFENTYSEKAEVVAQNGTEVTFEDATGNLWIKEDTRFKIGDKVKITFDNAGTLNNRTDDYIIKVKKI